MFLLLHGASADASDELALGQEKRQDHWDDRKHDRGHGVVPGERGLVDEGQPNLQRTHVRLGREIARRLDISRTSVRRILGTSVPREKSLYRPKGQNHE